MSESLAAACGQFEQVILTGMLRAAGIGRDAGSDEASVADDDDSEAAKRSGDDAFSQLVVESLAGAVERAGGIGLRPALLAALERAKR